MKNDIIQVNQDNVIVKKRKLYKTKGDTGLIYIPEKALEGFRLGWRSVEVKATLLVTLTEMQTLTYKYVAKLLPQAKGGKYAYRYYFIQIPARLTQTIESDLEDFGLELEDLTAEVQLLEGEKGLEVLILLSPAE